MLITTFDTNELSENINTTTENKNCVSRQAMIAHVISSGYTYANYIRATKKITGYHPGIKLESTSQAFNSGLDAMFDYTVSSLESFTDSELSETEYLKKIKAHWDKVYDVEQIMEHAIVHVMRHARQLKNLRGN